MNKDKIAIIGSGYMGFGMAKNLLKKYEVYVIAHKNRSHINKLVKLGATEVSHYKDLIDKKLNCLMMCVTNTPIAITIAKEISPLIEEKLFFEIDTS